MALLLKGFTDHTIDTGEVEIGYSVGRENGPPLLLLHGVTARRDIFVRVIDSLTPNFRVIAMDQRGHGYSGRTPGKYGRDDHARDIKYIIEHVCKEAPIVWGHSMGGGNSVELAGQEPALYRALMLEDPAIFSNSRPASRIETPTHVRFRKYQELLDEKLSMVEMVGRVREMIPSELDYYPAWRAETLIQMDPELLANVLEGKSRGGTEPGVSLSRIAYPVMIAQADPDAGGILPDDYLASVVPQRENFTVKKIVGAGHNISQDFPDLLLPVVLPWLEGLKN